MQSGGSIDRALRRRYGWLPYRVLATLCVLGCLLAVAADIAMWFLLPGYDPVAQTISELAAGPRHEVQDAGIIAFVIGVLSLTLGLVLRGAGGTRAVIVRGALLLIAADIAMIALWNEYGDGEPGGLEIHRWLLLGLYLLLAVTLWLAASVRSDRLGSKGRAAAIIWLVLAPLFFVVPDSIDGLYERVLALFLIGPVMLSGWRLFVEPGSEERARPSHGA